MGLLDKMFWRKLHRKDIRNRPCGSRSIQQWIRFTGSAFQFHHNLQSWPWRDKERPKEPEPTLEEVAAAYQDSPNETEREVRELVGMCLWDTFSNEHDVVGLDGRLVDIGSWRGAGGFIADQLNRQTVESKYEYMDFFMGTVWVSQRTDLAPVYEMIFRRLKERLLNWRYRFPELGLVEFSSDKPDGARSLRIEKMKAELKKIHREASSLKKGRA